MRRWVKAADRRAAEPVTTDARVPVLVGLGLWLVGLALVLIVSPTLAAADSLRLLITTIVGVGLGLIGLLYLRLKR